MSFHQPSSRALRYILLAAASALALPGLGHAAPAAATAEAAGANASSLEEIVVTAERRETRLLETPGAITAVTATELRARRIESLNDLAATVPGLSSTGGAPQTSLYIRGIGTSDPGSPPSVGVYVDDVYNPRAFGNNLFDLPDVQSVEVLRGPQGTLYGLNTSGGAIKVTSKAPSDTFDGSGLVEVGNLNAFRSQVYLTGPIVKGVLDGSVAYTGRKRDGYVYNQTLKYWVEDADSNEARLKLRFTPSDKLEATLSYTVLRDDSDTQSVVPLNYGDAGPRVTYSPHRFNPSRDVDTLSGAIIYRANEHLTLKSITAWRKLDNLNPNDASGLPTDVSAFIQFLQNRQWSQEVQALGDYGRLNFVVGAVWRRETFSMDRNAWQALAYSEILSNQTVVDKAVYGQANYDVTDKLRVTLGGRFSWEGNTFANAYYLTDSAFRRTRLVYSVAGLREHEHNFSPKIGVDYRLSPYLMTYASYTKGSKSGGFNRSASTALIANVPVSPEVVTAVEAGLKGRTPGGLLQGSFAVYHNDFKDFQATITNPTVDGQLIVGNVVANAAQATTYGAEAEASVQPTERLTWRVAAAYLHARFDSFENPTGAAASNFTGKWLPFASKWIASTSVNYVIPVSLPGELSARVSIDYHSPAYSDNANRPEVRVPTQLLTDLGVNYAPDGGHWNFLLLAKNLFSKTTIVGYRTVTPSLGIAAAKYGAPRLVTFSAKYSY